MTVRGGGSGEPTATHTGLTDFGREMQGAGSYSLTEALRDRAWRTARAEAYRLQVAMALLGFVGGLLLVVPAVLWLASVRHAGRQPPPVIAAESIDRVAAHEAVTADLTSRREHEVSPPAFEPVLTAPAVPAPVTASPTPDQRLAIESARDLIRAGQIQVARERLTASGLAETGEAAFVLAETYDPNVLAALGVTGLRADAGTARRYYEIALARGVVAAAQRLEALE